MSDSLLLVTLGPVQDFIAQARRTRDLWYGSELLSEVSRAAAQALAGAGADLVFPADVGHAVTSVANKVLALVPAGDDAGSLAAMARDVAFTRWREVAERVRTRCAGLIANGTEAVWREQIDSFLEFGASWAQIEDAGGYAAARERVEAAVAGRKRLRDFEPWREQRPGAPKSSLDGGRETVLRPAEERDAAQVGRYRIGSGEQLDAVGLVKRAGGEPEQFVPVINVATASWLEAAERAEPGALAALKTACQQLGLHSVDRPDLPCARPFPFDASILLPGRWRPVFRELGRTDDGSAWGWAHVGPLLRSRGEPYPYVACLVADGDSMGEAIAEMGSPDAHRRLSRRLSQFADEARAVVEQLCRGVLIYAGGDDVLAFLPLPEALRCADELRLAFARLMGQAGTMRQAGTTLSVGLGVGHVMESMGDLLELGREAKRAAKQSRDALAIVLDKRSGGRRVWASRWGRQPRAHIEAAGELLRQRLPMRKVYEIARTLRRLPRPGVQVSDDWAEVLTLEVGRSLARIEEGPLSPDDVGLDLGPDYAGAYRAVEGWVGLMQIAHAFAQAQSGQPRGAEVAA